MANKPSLSREEAAERSAEIATAVADGRAVESVAEEFGISVGTVYECCRRNGIVLRQSDALGHRATAAARRRQVVLAALRGDTHREITANLGFEEDSIRQICSDAGVALRPVLRPSEVRVLRERQEVAARLSRLAADLNPEQIALLRALGDVRCSIPQVAEVMGCSRAHAWQVFRLARGRLAALSKAEQLPPLPPLPDPVQLRLSTPHDPTPRPRRRPATRVAPRLSTEERAKRAARAAARSPKRPAKAVAARREDIAAALKSGLSAAQVAAKFNVSVGAVYDARRDSGWGTAHVSPLEARRLAILQLAARGNFADSIAKKIGVTPRYVRLLCKRRGVDLETRGDRIDAARVQARHLMLEGVDLRRLLDGKDVKILRALRDTDLPLAELGKRLRAPGRTVFEVWTRALDRLAVPKGSGHLDHIAARRRVFSSGISHIALCRAVGGHHKLVQRLRKSDLTIEQLARNARTSVQEVMRIWYLALDRSAIVAARLGPIAPSTRPRRRLTKRERRVLRDLVL